MKKKFVLLILICLFFLPLIAFAESDEFDTGYDVFTKARNLKPVSEEEVQQVLKALEERKQKNANRKPWWRFWGKEKSLKGDALSTQGSDAQNDNVIEKSYLLIQLTEKVLGKNSIIEPGFYTVVFNKDTETLSLKQGYNSIGEIKMTSVAPSSDFEELYYIKTKQENENIRFIYGEIDKHYEGFGRILK